MNEIIAINYENSFSINSSISFKRFKFIYGSLIQHDVYNIPSFLSLIFNKLLNIVFLRFNSLVYISTISRNIEAIINNIIKN